MKKINTFNENIKEQRNIIYCCKKLRDGGISQSSDFAAHNKDTLLTFILNCRSDYLVAYPQKEQKTYKTKLSRMKLDFQYLREVIIKL